MYCEEAKKRLDEEEKAGKFGAKAAEEREEFVQTQDVAHMTSRELERAIRERDAARKQAQDAEGKIEIPQEKLDKLAKDAEDAAKKRFEEQKKKLLDAAKESEQKAKDAEARVEELRRKLSTASKETAQFELMFRKVQEDFAELLKMVATIEDGNAELGQKLRKAVAAVAEDVLRKVGGV